MNLRDAQNEFVQCCLCEREAEVTVNGAHGLRLPYCEDHHDQQQEQAAQRRRDEELETRCPECGPDVSLDEDLCCAGCGNEATAEGRAEVGGDPKSEGVPNEG